MNITASFGIYDTSRTKTGNVFFVSLEFLRSIRGFICLGLEE